LTEAATVLTRAQAVVGAAKTFAASALAPEFNDCWQTDGPLTEDEFAGRISLQRIIIRCDRADFHFEESGLFAGQIPGCHWPFCYAEVLVSGHPHISNCLKPKTEQRSGRNGVRLEHKPQCFIKPVVLT